MTEKTEKTEKTDDPKQVEHKVGLHTYSRVGENDPKYIIIGAPNVRGKRWVTVAFMFGGIVQSYPEEVFLRNYWIPSPADK